MVYGRYIMIYHDTSIKKIALKTIITQMMPMFRGINIHQPRIVKNFRDR